MSISTDLQTKNVILYECNKCEFSTEKKTDFNRHLITKKHKKINLATEKNDKILYKCEICQKTYLERTGLWRHKKRCFCKETNIDKNNTIIEINSNDSNKAEIYELAKYLMDENNELKNIITELTNVIKSLTNNQVS